MFLVLAAQGYPALAQLRVRFLALWAPRVRMSPRGSLARSTAQLFLALAAARVGGYPPAVRHGLLFQLPARPGQLRRRRKITQPH